MPRAPFQVLIFPWRLREDGGFEYAVFKRSDQGFWQGLSGGGEDVETPIEAARRECGEEACIPEDAEFIELDTTAHIPAHIFAGHEKWGKDTYVIPEYSFGVDFSDEDIELSAEHSEYRWVSLEEAHRLLKHDSNKTAIWELEQRLKRLGE
ncbi:MAG: NUDIX hydrolase [Candidatus Sumerlaeota bacterium]